MMIVAASDISEAMTVSDPTPLFDRLMAVKPDGLSNHGWASRAGLSRSFWTDVRKNNRARHDSIERLLAAAGVTWAEYEAGAKAPVKDDPAGTAVRAPFMAFRGDDRPRDIPILGTAECADIDFSSDDVRVAVETMTMALDEVVDYARRPVTLDSRRDVYAIYFRGESLEPRYEPGEIAYVDPVRPPAARDYVVVQLRDGDGDGGERIVRVMAKRFVRRTATFVELQQFNPPAVFRVAREQVAHIHRIIPWDELVSF